MLKTFQKKDLLVRVFLGFVVGIIGLMMVVTLVPGPVGSLGSTPDAVAEVGGEVITVADVQTQLRRIERSQPIPRALQGLFARQIVDQLVFEKLLEMEAKRLGIRVTDEERSERIKLLLPVAFAGDTFIGMERYSAEVERRFEMPVAQFEELIRKSLLEDKFRRLVTDGLTVSPEEVEEEFKRRNEKVKIEYALLKPAELESRVAVNDAELAAFFEKNKARYQVPERRAVVYALLDLAQIRQRTPVKDDELREYYNQHVDRYHVQNRARVSHILFKTVGKTDAEVEEIRKKAEDVLKKAKRGGKFEDLAKQYSEDTTKDKGGDLGWIVPRQTVAEFENVAFQLPPGQISDLVRTQYGFHIIKVVERQTARTLSFEEVRPAILAIIEGQKVEKASSDLADQIAAEVRNSGKQPIATLARKFGMTVKETGPVAVNDPLGDLGSGQPLYDIIFKLRPEELSSPVKLERGIVVVAVKEIRPAHQGTLAEVREKAAADFKSEKATELARTLAADLARRAQGGEALAQAAKQMGFAVKTSEPFARIGSVPELGSSRELAAAFSLEVGKTGAPAQVGSNWAVFRVVSREEAKAEELAKQRKEIEQQVLQNKRSIAHDAFRKALQERMQREGKLQLNAENLRRLTRPT